MPWENQNDNISFSGPLADLMGIIMTAYDQDSATDTCMVSPGVYVTASAVVLREVLIESLESDTDAAQFVQHLSDALHEDDDGTVRIATFEMLDEIAEHISVDALEGWVGSPEVRAAINDLGTSAFPA